ncbi:hypothetical protein [Devosia nitrariae]|uniref:Tail assembly chaperone n=1 Tax=Devosia nitrariae TaxID=2071872 RepID=A0ABQ5W0L1_9HYPH|nr:hypothetical protein [Devosia nitrariae]GLQ53597.1 hypothetical protein GCM10010862_08560 [Devosia nitrariae]
MSLDAELESLLASAEDTHRIDRIGIRLYNRETGAAQTKNIAVRGATFQELALFFKRFPEAFSLVDGVFGGDDDKEPDLSVGAIVALVLQIPTAMSTLNSCFLGRPFDEGTMASLDKMAPEANLEILETGIFKSFDGDIPGFFGKKLKSLAKAAGLNRTSATTSESSSKTRETAAS